MPKLAPITILHGLGLDLHEIARNTVYKNHKGVPYSVAKKWFNEPTKDVKPQFQAMFEAAIKILKEEGRIK